MTFVDSPATLPTLQMQRWFDAPRELVWRAWTNPEVMVMWLGPVEWPAVSATQDLRVGGVWRACLRSLDTGQDQWQGGIYREIVPNERLVFTLKWDETHEDGDRGETLVTVQLSDAPRGGTLMDFSHGRLKSEDSMTGCRHGWTSSFERLEAFLAHNKDQ